MKTNLDILNFTGCKVFFCL